MADKDTEPAPVDVKASVPLEIKVAPESIKALGGDAAKSTAPTLESIARGAEPTPVLIAAEQPPVPVAIESSPEAPVSVTATEPIPVIVKDAAAPPPRPDVVKGEGVTLAPTTTEQDDKVTEGQRHINRVWEYTQAAIAVLITLAIVYCAINKISSQDLTNSFFLIIGFYFSRTNHQAQGGTGAKPMDKSPRYEGRSLLV